MNDLTPIERIEGWYVKRDDKYERFGLNGGKLRAAESFIYKHNHIKGIVTAGSSVSPQTLIVSKIAEKLGVDCRIHIPKTHKLGREVIEASRISTLIGHCPGYNNVIISKAKKDAELRDYLYVPFGMDCIEAVIENSKQAENIPIEVKIIVVPIGSGITFSGIYQRLKERDITLVGIITGARPDKIFEKYAFDMFYSTLEKKNIKVKLFTSLYDYHYPLAERIGSLELDEIYESKAWNYIKNFNLEDGLFWIVGKRKYSGFIDLPKDFWISENKTFFKNPEYD